MGHGYDPEDDVVEYFVKHIFVGKKGAWFYRTPCFGFVDLLQKSGPFHDFRNFILHAYCHDMHTVTDLFFLQLSDMPGSYI